jgi:ElaA protein
MITWYTKKFSELNPYELYAILRLRSEVFVVEQNCVFQDMDNKDQQCFHLMGWSGLPDSNLTIVVPDSDPGIIPDPDRGVIPDSNPGLVACSRLVPPGVAYEFPSIGRVVSSPAVRHTGMGKLLMEKSIAELVNLYGNTAIRIGAQLYLKRFYESFGFVQSGDEYDEDGIPHIEMTRSIF